MTPRHLSLLLLLAGLSLSTEAPADNLTATHGGELEEVMHRVQVRQDGEDLIMSVRRAYKNHGHRVEEAAISITLPPGAVATGLRSKLGKTWYPGEFMPAKQASRLYKQLTEHGKVGKEGPALLSFQSTTELQLEIFPIVPGGEATVEYELRVPTCYRDGFQVAFYPKTYTDPKDDPELRTPRLLLAKGTRGAIRSAYKKLEEKEASAVDQCTHSSWMAHNADEEQYILIEHEPAIPVSARASAHVVGGSVISELSIQLAPELSEMPAQAELVFVVDASYSQGKKHLELQLKLIEDYLSFLPDARFEIVLTRRRAERVWGKLQPAQRAPALLAQLRRQLPDLGNGSNLDAGVQLAGSVFSAKGMHPQRIIALTDSRLRMDLKARVLETALSSAPHALMHILITNMGAGAVYEFHRQDDHELADVAMGSGGMAVELYGERTTANATREGLLGLVRPVQIDHMELRGTEAWSEVPEVAEEGYGYRSMVLLEHVPDRVSLRGKIWGKTVQVAAKIDQTLSSHLAALIFGRSLVDDLNPTQLLAAATFGRVVSPVTSFLARNPRAAPSSYDYDDDIGMIGLGSFGTSSSCGGCCGLHGTGTAGVLQEEPGIASALTGLLEERAQACESLHDGQISTLALQIETTGKEIVDVIESSEKSPLSHCVVEAAWELHLGEFFAGSQGRYEISF